MRRGNSFLRWLNREREYDGKKIDSAWWDSQPRTFYIKVDDLLLYHHLKLALPSSRFLRLEFFSAVRWPRQALEIDLRPGKISLEDLAAPAFSIFYDTAPKISTFHLKPKRTQRDFSISHAWHNDRCLTGLIGPFGILVNQESDRLLISCK